MAVSRKALVDYLDNLLKHDEVADDPSNNGLQVEGVSEVKRVTFGVDACQALFTAAVEKDADFVFVHHGLSWGSGFRYVEGVLSGRMRTLFKNGVSLYASHLPLDRHPEIGHNVLIARIIGLQNLTPFFKYGSVDIGCFSSLSEPLKLTELVSMLDEGLSTSCQVIEGKESQPASTVGIVSGGGADAIEECCRHGIDCLVTGELEHKHFHQAMEAGVNVVVAGHYRTEVPGVQEVKRNIEEDWGVTCDFVDVPTGF